MSVAEQVRIELTEYQAEVFPASAIPQEVGMLLWHRYAAQVQVEPPTFLNGQRWKLTAQGWVGHVPLSTEFSLVLRPKVPLGNLFGMFEYAYRLQSFYFLEDLVDCESLDDFYEQLAKVLSLRVLDRSRKGFYRAYLARTEQLPYVSGRLDTRRLSQKPWHVKPQCHYQEHTADVEENQLLSWTLRHVLRSGVCTARVLPTVRRAYRVTRSFTTLQPYAPQDCVGRLYSRLNDDYQPMHALCRFFLEHTGPSHEIGDRAILPFLVDMARLYELFVAEWLDQHLCREVAYVKAQERVTVGAQQTLRMDIDLTLYDARTHRVICVLDTKYKVPDAPSQADIFQVMAYAQAKECQEAVLIYPTSLEKPLDVQMPRVRVRSLPFSVDGDLEEAGQAFVQVLYRALGLDGR